MMKTIQMTLDDDLIHDLDALVKEQNSNRSAFTRKALRKAINTYRQHKLIEQHRKGYEKYPVSADEFSVWEDEQASGRE